MINDFKKHYSINDEWITPPNAVKPIMAHIHTGTRIWAPFDTEESEYVKMLRAHGCEVVPTHIDTGTDFFEAEPPAGTQYIVSNPPFSVKSKIVERLCSFNVPFAMLLNASGVFDNKRMYTLAKENNLQVMYLYPRVNYIRDGEIVGGGHVSIVLPVPVGSPRKINVCRL